MPLIGFLATFDGNDALGLAPTELEAAACSLEGLRTTFLERTGQDAPILHTGGLELGGQKEPFTVRLELAAPFTAPTTAYPPLPHARPWQRPGWFRENLTWLEEVLDEKVQGLEQVSTNDLGTVLRVSTASRKAYFKTSERRLEATLTAHIASTHPGLTPQVIAWDAPKNLLLTEDCGSRLSETADLGLWQSAVHKLVHVQDTANAAPLQEHGSPSHPFDHLAERAAHFLQDKRVLEHWILNPQQIAALQERLPTILAAHERLGRLELPLLPAHGDAHPMNVLTGCGVVLFDWSDMCLAHPLLDIGWFLAWLSHPGRRSLPLRQQHSKAVEILWAHYLQNTSLAGTRIYLSDAMLLALIHRALAYHERYADWQGTLKGWRPQYVPYLLRSLLKLPLER